LTLKKGDEYSIRNRRGTAKETGNIYEKKIRKMTKRAQEISAEAKESDCGQGEKKAYSLITSY